MMTFEQAVSFLTNALHMENVGEKMKDRLLLLDEIVRRFHQYIPFQNLTILAQDPVDRHLPTIEDICQSMSLGEGGICYSLATFARVLLTALGYDAFSIACSIRPSFCRPPFTHVATLARGVSHPDDLYLVEVGTSFPTFQPVPLHRLPQEYKNAFHEYKFVQEGQEIARYIRQKNDSGKEEWWRFYQFEPIPRDDSFMKKCQGPIYTEPGYGAKWYLLELKMSIYPKDMAVTVSQDCLKVWSLDTNEVKAFPLKTSAEYEEAIIKYFPMLREVDTVKALELASAENNKFQQTQKK